MPGKGPPGMWENLLAHAYGDKELMEWSHAAFLRGRSAEGDHGFMLAAIRQSNLHPGAKAGTR
jgi:hypothetical protein